MSEETKKPGYLINYIKQTSMLGESVQVTTNLPEGASEDDLTKEFIKIGNALDRRMRDMNKLVIEKTGKNLEEMGIDPGTIFIDEPKE